MFQELHALLNLRGLLVILFCGGLMRFLLATCLITFFPQHLLAKKTTTGTSSLPPSTMNTPSYPNSGEQKAFQSSPISTTGGSMVGDSPKQEEQVKPNKDIPDFQVGPFKGNEYQYKVNHEDDNEQQQ